MLNVSKSIAVALLFLVALTLSLGHPAAAEESVAAVLFSQPPDPAGGLYQSSWWFPNESDFDKFLWDNFTLTQNQDITAIQWRGGYDPNVFNGAGTVVDFEVAIYASNGAEPAYLSGPLVTYPTGGNAGETSAGIFGGVAMYDYTFSLPVAFQAQVGTKYWVYIVATQTGNPDWGLSKATGGDTHHFRLSHDGSIPEFRSGDLAFTLLGPPTPINGLSATNDSPTQLGQATSFTATVSSGSGVSYDWNFGDQTAGSGGLATHIYATAGVYTAAVTASNSLGSVMTTTPVTVTEVATYGVDLSADDSLSGPAGQTVTYTLTITNTGAVADSFDLTATGQSWTTTLSTSLVSLAPSGSKVFTVAVSIPLSAVDQEADTVTTMTTSQGDGSKTDSALLTTTAVVAPVYGVALSPDESLFGPVGDQVIYTVTITNTGNMTDSFDLTATGQTWATNLPTSHVNLAPSASKVFTAAVAIPPGATDQETDTVTITVTSQGDGSKSDSALLTTTAVLAPVYGVALSADESLSGPAGGQAIYNLTVTNSGTVADTVDLLPIGNGWTTTPSSRAVSLAAGGSRAVMITVLIPPTAAAFESDRVTIQATSRHDGRQSDTTVLTTVSSGWPVKTYLPLVMLNRP